MNRFIKLMIVGAVVFSLPMVLKGAPQEEKTEKKKPAQSQVDSKGDLILQFRDAELAKTAQQELPEYGDKEPGESQSFGAAFPGAPPQIPHTTADFLPIKGDENQCLECHDRENAADYGAIAVHESHYMKVVMKKGSDKDPQRLSVDRYDPQEGLNGGFFNCVACHTPQTTNVSDPPNSFAAAKGEKDKKQ